MSEKKYLFRIKRALSEFITIDGRKVRTPVEFIIPKSQLAKYEIKMRQESITEYEVIEL